MNMRIVERQKCFCTCCMEEHQVAIVLVQEQSVFKNTEVFYEASYHYCNIADELYMDEAQMQENDIRLKDAYRRIKGLLTSGEICSIRRQYGISQSDFCTLLGWGGKTITRYESHQVQDKAHDAILKKIKQDPEWFLTLLIESTEKLPETSYQRYRATAIALYEKCQDVYLRKAIEAAYVGYEDDPQLNGNTKLSLDKVIEVIRYFASSSRVTNLYKPKLIKLLWRADTLSYQNRGNAITGLIYRLSPTGVIPLECNSIINLKGVPYKEADMGDTYACYFSLTSQDSFDNLSKEDKKVLDTVIEEYEDAEKNETIDFICKEQEKHKAIFFKYKERLNG